MTRAIALSATLMLLAVCWCGPASGASIRATLTPAKDSYVVGDPVELILTLTNGGTEEVGCQADYPFYGLGHTAVSVWPAGSPEGDRAQPSDTGVVVVIGQIPIQPVPAGGSWSVRLFLSRFVGSVGLGTHRLRYSVDIPCYGMDSQSPASLRSGRPEPNRQWRTAALGEGEFIIEMQPEAADRLADVVRTYTREAQGDPDYWRERSAVEAVSLMDSPMVIPCLKRILEAGWTDFGVLAKFRGNPDAEELLKTSIRAGSVGQLPSAVPVLRQWQYVLDAGDFATLLSRGAWDVRMAAFRYAESLGNASYIPIVESYAENPEAAVAKEAQRVAASLRRSSK